MLLVVLGIFFFLNNSHALPGKALEIRYKDIEKLSHIKPHMYWLRKMAAVEREGKQMCLF